MTDIDRFGGAAALVCGLTYVFGFTLLVGLLMPAGFGADGMGADAALAAVADNRGLVQLWYFVIYVVNAVFLVIVAVALAELFRRFGAEGLGRLSLATGTIWATLVLGAGMVMNVGLGRVLPLYDAGSPDALILWQVVDLVENGLGGGNEIAGGVWAIVAGLAGLKTAALSRPLSILSLIIGVSGLLTVIPGLAEIFGSIFGLGFIGWFFWIGFALYRANPARHAPVPASEGLTD